MCRTFHLQKVIQSIFLILGIFFVTQGSIQAALPSQAFRFQGQLYSSGTPVDGAVSATFTFYDSESGGSQTGSIISKTIQVSNGYFGAVFDDVDTSGVDFNQALYIEISINGTTLSPRSAVSSSLISNNTFGVFTYTSTPAVGKKGSLYYNSTLDELFVSKGTSWVNAGTSSSTAQWFNNGSDLYFTTGNVGIGTSTPADKLSVVGTVRATSFVGDGSQLTGIPVLSTSSVRSMFSSTATGLTYTAGTGVFSLAAGYVIPLTASTTEWATFFNTPSSQIIAGTNLAWSGNTINFNGILPIANGGTGTTTTPTIGKLLLGNASGGYDLVATSSLGISGGSGSLSGGTNGYLARWIGTSTLSSGLFMDNGTVAGINATSSSYTFNIRGTAGLLPFNVASSTGTSLFSIAQNGNVRIDSADTLYKLNVGGNAVFGASSKFVVATDYAGLGDLPAGSFLGGAGAASGSLAFAPSSDVGAVGAKMVLAYYNGAWKSALEYANTSGGYTTLALQKGGGNVAINTTTANHPLDVNGIINSQTGSIYLRRNLTNDANRRNWGFQTEVSNIGDFQLQVSTTNIGAPTTAVLTALLSGNVGIGVATPLAKLAVIGTGSNDILSVLTSGGTSAFVVKSTGSVGIGIASPGHTLDLGAVSPTLNVGLYGGGGAATIRMLGEALFYFSGGSVGSAIGIGSADTTADFDLAFHAGGSNRMFVDGATGYVGIGTSNPVAKLQIGTAGSVLSNPNGISIVGGDLNLDNGSGSTDNSIYFRYQNTFSTIKSDAGLTFQTGASPTNRLSITALGNIGIGTTTPSASLTASGTIRFTSLGSGGANLITDSLGNVTVSSDEQLKDIQGEFKSGLEKILGINPILYKWKDTTGYDTTNIYAGFSAQNVKLMIPEAVTTDARGFLTLADRPILATLINAIKELALKFENFGKQVETEELCIKKKDGTKVCLTAEQLETVLAGEGIQNTVVSTPAPDPVPTPDPVLDPEPEEAPATSSEPEVEETEVPPPAPVEEIAPAPAVEPVPVVVEEPVPEPTL
ncbi:MAG: tail fiber domain-containing protein [Patescibacteria group bacterium]